MRSILRCAWARTPLAIEYHDREWGVPVRDDASLFEFLVLEGAQAGLSWDTILAKRENYRRAFDRFEPGRVARYGAEKKAMLLADAGIVRNRAKIEAAVVNARAFLAVQKAYGSFARYLWQYVDARPLQGKRRSLADVPGRTELSNALASDLRARGFKFVGSTIVYAFMQAVGMVNDHTAGCFRRRQVEALAMKRWIRNQRQCA